MRFPANIGAYIAFFIYKIATQSALNCVFNFFLSEFSFLKAIADFKYTTLAYVYKSGNSVHSSDMPLL